MLKTRLAAARKVAAPLIELEKLIDRALVVHAELQVALIESRQEAKLPLHAGQAGLEAVATTAERLIGARKAIHAAHYDFRDVQDRMGLGRHAMSSDPGYGDHGNTPREFMVADRPALSVVGEAA